VPSNRRHQVASTVVMIHSNRVAEYAVESIRLHRMSRNLRCRRIGITVDSGEKRHVPTSSTVKVSEHCNPD